MSPSQAIGETVPSGTEPYRIGCVSFLNSKPLIEALVGRADVDVQFAVPSALLPLLDLGPHGRDGQGRGVEAALLSAVDYHACRRDLVILPAGCIACDGPTLTVRIFSRVPPPQITTLYGDTDSHTSVHLAQVVLRRRYGARPRLVSWTPPVGGTIAALPASLLLIGDKVVNAAPPAREYPYQLDLGEEWKHLTGLPFVFASWMAAVPASDPTGTGTPRVRAIHDLLAGARAQGATMTETLLDRYAAEKRWPRDLARRYFTSYLRYAWTEPMKQGLALFYQMAAEEGLIKMTRPVKYMDGDGGNAECGMRNAEC